jgi:hypothetical protein
MLTCVSLFICFVFVGHKFDCGKFWNNFEKKIRCRHSSPNTVAVLQLFLGLFAFLGKEKSAGTQS